MASSELDKKILERIESFVNELTRLVKRSAVESVQVALGDSGARVALGRGRRGIALGKELTSGRGRGAGRGKKGAKRTGKQLENLKEKLRSYIKSNPGQRIEQIAAAIGIGTRQLALPIKKLLAEKKIKKKGKKRATSYFAR